MRDDGDVDEDEDVNVNVVVVVKAFYSLKYDTIWIVCCFLNVISTSCIYLEHQQRLIGHLRNKDA